MYLSDVAKERSQEFVVNGLVIFVPRQPSNKQALKEWRRLLRASVKLAHAGIVGKLGCVVPPRPRVDTTEWDRWYRYAHRATTRVKAFERPKKSVPLRVSKRSKNERLDILKILALMEMGHTAESLQVKLGVSYTRARQLCFLAKNEGRHTLKNQYSDILRRVQAVRVQDMEVAAM